MPGAYDDGSGSLPKPLTTEDIVADSSEESFESQLASMAVGDYLANPEDPHSFYQKSPDGVVLHQCPDADAKRKADGLQP